VVFLSLVTTGSAQVKERPQEAEPWDLTLSPQASPVLLPQSGLPQGSIIDPKYYVVGPSDVISVNIWSAPPVNMNLTVTPEGTLILPSVGEVVVGDKKLSDVKDEVIGLTRKRFRKVEVTVTLVRPRMVNVRVEGQVLHPGSYAVSAGERVEKAIEEANRLLRTETPYDLAPVLASSSTRNIVVSHSDGTETRVDLRGFFATRIDSLNPYLRGGDVISVPRRNDQRNVIGVYGEVNNPGRLEFVRGDRVLNAIRMAGGINRNARTDSVELSHLDLEGKTITREILPLGSVVAGTASNALLEPGDRILIPSTVDRRQDFRVFIEGEVKHPGYYPITRNRTRLSEVIRLAGGTTEYAALRTAQLLRRSIAPSEVDLERLESLRGGVAPDDSAYYILETGLRIAKEVVVVDFEALLVRGDTTQNVFLRTDDYIRIPSARKTVYVFGQVVSTGHIPHVDGEDVSYYVRLAGGFTDKARQGDVRIIKAKTKQWLVPAETTIEEGDYIWVPRNPDRPFWYYMTVISQAASILSLAVSVVLIATQVGK
jgi:protein involved in polysaccharide export with SLBB domain